MLADFVSVCVYLAEKAGEIIRDVHNTGKLDIETKDDESPVTIADLKA